MRQESPSKLMPPPAKPVVWQATYNGKTIEVTAQTWHFARQEAMQQFHCEPTQVELKLKEES